MAKRERLSAAEWICTGLGIASFIVISKPASELQAWVEWTVIGGLCLIGFMAAYVTSRRTALTPDASRNWYVVAFVPWLASAVAGTIVLMIVPSMLWNIVAVQSLMFWAGVSLALELRRRRAEARGDRGRLRAASMRIEVRLD